MARSVASILCQALLLATLFNSCRSGHLPSPSTGGRDYTKVVLVADTPGFDALRIDSNLVNPWGISISSRGSIWISANRKKNSVVYDSTGNQALAPVGIRLGTIQSGATPTGVVFNGGNDFVVNGKIARFIYCTEQGTITAWTSGDSTTTVADRSAVKAIYKGIAITSTPAGSRILAADFYNSRIDVFDAAFQPVGVTAYSDPGIPPGFAPFNIRDIDGNIYITYAKQQLPSKDEDETGPGNGYISVFDTAGHLLRRFASGGSLNSPWGIIKPPAAFGQQAGAILVANFGDGRINVFDSLGTYIGPLENDGIPIIINGLWDIAFAPSNGKWLYFTSGPSGEKHGTFGFIRVN